MERAEQADDRVERLLGEMTLEEKVGQLNVPYFLPEATSGSWKLERKPSGLDDALELAEGTFNEKLGPAGGFFGLADTSMVGDTLQAQADAHARLQRAARETRLGIPLLQIAEGTHGMRSTGATIFPEGPSLGSTFDTDLLIEIYEAIARESRAAGVHMLCTLMAEPIRDPRLGRNCEGFTEDPYYAGRIIEAVIQGVQGADPSAPDRVAALLTDFPASSIPSSGLERGAIELSERSLRETFLPVWQAGIGAGALALMTTYNAIDGVPAHASKWLMTDLLRDELGFEGIAVSEGLGFETLQYDGIVETQKEAGILSIRAGVDVNITYEEAYLDLLVDSVRDGSVSEELIDRAVRRVLRVKEALGLFEEDPDASRLLADGPPASHSDLALRAARAGIVLLKNEGAVLPLAKDVGRVAVLGPLAGDWRSILGDYTTKVISQPVQTIAEAITAKAGDAVEVVHERGCDQLGDDRSQIAAAVAAAEGADVAVVCVGEALRKFPDADRTSTIGELNDLADLDLSGVQEELVQAVHATGTPTVVVLINGRALSVRWIAEHVPAVVEGFLPGERGAEALADVLFGDHDPAGRLPVSFPVHAGQLPVCYDHKPWRESYWVRGFGYVGMPAQALFAFGHGLSYTEFAYSDLEVEDASSGTAVATVSVTVENVGARAGTEVVQLYVGDRWSSVATPVRRLCGFAKVVLEPGERRTVRLPVHAQQLALFDQDHRTVVEPGEFDVEVGRSSADIRLRGELTVAAEIAVSATYPVGVTHTHV